MNTPSTDPPLSPDHRRARSGWMIEDRPPGSTPPARTGSRRIAEARAPQRDPPPVPGPRSPVPNTTGAQKEKNPPEKPRTGSSRRRAVARPDAGWVGSSVHRSMRARKINGRCGNTHAVCRRTRILPRPADAPPRSPRGLATCVNLTPCGGFGHESAHSAQENPSPHRTPGRPPASRQPDLLRTPPITDRPSPSTQPSMLPAEA